MAMVITYDGDPDRLDGPQRVRKIIGTWTSDGSGDASASTKKIAGRILKIATNPGATAPTDNYDITVTDANSLEIFAVAIAAQQPINRDTANSEQQYPMVLNSDASALAMAIQPVVCDVLTIAVANAGAAKNGVLEIYWTPDAS